jgi:hypothetical protein
MYSFFCALKLRFEVALHFYPLFGALLNGFFDQPSSWWAYHTWASELFFTVPPKMICGEIFCLAAFHTRYVRTCLKSNENRGTVIVVAFGSKDCGFK